TRQPGQVRKEAALTSTDRVARQPPTQPRLRRRTARITAFAAVSGRPWCDTKVHMSEGPKRETSAEPEQSGLGLGGDTAASYRVLARKYRPSNFDDLIGQDAMVRTVSNAFDTGRIPQAWILSGVRGVGKTTTARILARALNYELLDGSVKGPTIHMPV